MTTPLVGSPGGSSDSLLPVTGFGPGTIVIAAIGGALTLAGVIMRHVGHRPTMPSA